MWPGNGQQGPLESRATYGDVWLAVVALLGIIALGIGAVFWVKRWREEPVEVGTLSHAELLAHYQKMADEGDLDPDEFARLKAHLERRAGTTPPTANQPPDTSIQE